MEIQNHSQLYRLSWDHHQDNFIKICKDLLYNESFSDVTLIVEGANFIKCHKVILAASSTYFAQVFASLPDEHVMVALNNDIKSILAILEYIYKGEVNIPKSQLQSLIAAATNLKIKGLTDKSEFTDEQISEDSRQGNSYSRVSPPGNATSTSKSTYNRNKKESPTHLSNGIGTSKRNFYNMYENPLVSNNIPDWVRSSVPIVNNPFLMSGRHQAAMEALPQILQNTMDGPVISNNLYSHRPLSMNTGILRNALGHGQNGASQPAVLPNNYENLHSNISERSHFEKKTQNKSTNNSSTYSNQLQTDEGKKLRLEQPSTSSQAYPRNQDTKWKRYKQYSPEALRTAIIEVIFAKESALQSSRKLKVPSRTLYDKVKKVQAVLNANGWNTTDNKAEILHVIQGNSFSRALETNNGNGSSQNINHIQHSPEDHDDDEENFLPSTIPSANFTSTTNQQNLQCRSPSPGPSTLYKPYNSFGARGNNNGITNEQTTDDEDDYNQVEDLSMKKKEEPEVMVSPNSQSSTRTEEIIDAVDDTGQDKMEDHGSVKSGKE